MRKKDIGSTPFPKLEFFHIMNFFDLVFSLLIVGFLLFGFFKGSLRAIFSTLGLAIGYIGAERFYLQYKSITQQYIENSDQAEIITYLTILAAGIVIGMALSTLVGVLLVFQRPSFYSRILGGILGLMKGVLICLLIFSLIYYFPAFSDDLNASLFSPWFLEFKDWMNGIIFALISDKIPT